VKRLVAVKTEDLLPTDPVSVSPTHVEISGAASEEEARWAAYAWVYQGLKDYTKMEDPPDISELYRMTQVVDLESVSKVEIERDPSGPLAKLGELMRKKDVKLLQVQMCHRREAGTFCGYCDSALAEIDSLNAEIDQLDGLAPLRKWVEDRKKT